MYFRRSFSHVYLLVITRRKHRLRFPVSNVLVPCSSPRPIVFLCVLFVSHNLVKIMILCRVVSFQLGTSVPILHSFINKETCGTHALTQCKSGCSTERWRSEDLPLPIHILVTNTWPPVLWSSESPVTTCLTPAVKCVRVRGTWQTMEEDLLIPSGWVSAMEPPLVCIEHR